MAAHRRPGPRGAAWPGASSVRLARCGTRQFTPGAVGTAAAARHAGAPTSFAGGEWLELQGIKVGCDALFLLARDADGDGGYRRIDFRSAEQAAAAAQALLANDALRLQLRELSGLAADEVAAWLARQLLAATLRVLWRPRSRLVLSKAAPMPAAPAPVRAAPAPAPAAPAYATFPPELDAAAVTQSLVSAAQNGVPFCEECQKARAAATGDAHAGSIA